MATWIDFKALRSKLRFDQVLRHYGVEVKAEGTQHHGFCPLPTHNGKKNSQSFSANLEKGIFNCFGCGAKGNLLDFAAMMAGANVDSGTELRSVAIELRDKFCPEAEPPKKKVKGRVTAEQFELPAVKPIEPSRIVINAPLDFELKRLDPRHPYLDKRGFTPETIYHFGLGFCNTGLLAGRIAIPIHNHDGKLVGYCGRIVDDTLIREDTPKYKFPPKRERNGIVYEFHKLELLYNSHRLTSPVEELCIVEGFPSVWWLIQMGFPNVVALMGWAMSDEQAAIVANLVPPSGRVWVITDGDDAGLRCATIVFQKVSPLRFLKWLRLDEGKQPTDYPGGWYRNRFKQ
jgi:DNA primase